ncbi:MAG: arylsulfatase A-like enzyme [Limisphaerales bacterium]|jgi:arylsulfatase A-like enzyme
MKFKPSLHLLLITTLVAAASVSAAATRPNLLIIYTDEHHYNTLGCYGGKIVKTPNIDWLAKNGTLCDRFYATTPVCSPSRGALVSGRYPQNTPVVQNNIPLADDTVTFASFLKTKGYATGFAGKWHLDGGGKPQWAPKRQFGFDDNRFMFNRGHWKKFADTAEGPQVGARDKKGNPGYGVNDADDKSFATDWLTDKALDFIDKNKDGPFCYMLSLPDPHGPNTVRAPYNTMYVGVDVPIPVSLNKTEAQTPKWAARERNVNPRWLKGVMPQYYGMVKCIDDNVGRLLDCLRKHGALENTFIVFTSDHGDLCGEHGKSNKGNPYEGSARVPFIMYAPGSAKKGHTLDQALGCVDFMPTILPLMGYKSPSTVQGRDASNLFRGKGAESWNDFNIMRSTSGQSWIAAVDKDLKLIFSQKDEPWLFDRAADPHELDNLYGKPKYKQRVQRLAAQLLDYGQKFDDPYLADSNFGAQVKAVLE